MKRIEGREREESTCNSVNLETILIVKVLYIDLYSRSKHGLERVYVGLLQGETVITVSFGCDQLV